MAYGVNAPFGLKPVRLQSGAIWNGQQNEYLILSGYNQNIFTNDPVYVATTGAFQASLSIATAGDTNPLIGSFQGCRYTTPTGTVVFAPFWPANTVTQNALPAAAFVADDANLIFDIQVGNNAGQGVRETDLYRNADLIAGAGSVFSGQSGWMLDQTTIAVGPATKQLKILRLTPNPVNRFDTVASPFPFNNVEVVINNDYYKGGTGTVGGA
jgi:hypothetical protein